VGETEDSPRGESLLSEEERNSYFNLILLCPTHHRIIDQNPNDYPVAKLHMMKAQHELWVEQTLSKPEDLHRAVQELIYADLADAAAELCHFDDWDRWAGQLMSVERHCDVKFAEDIDEFNKKILRTIWPQTLPELERALKTLAWVMKDVNEKFGEHAEYKEGKLYEDKSYKFYKVPQWVDPEQHKQRLNEYEAWGNEVDALVVEATKAANWVADVFRRDMNPLFYATKGKFTITYGPLEDLSWKSILPQYTPHEKDGMPYKSQSGGE